VKSTAIVDQGHEQHRDLDLLERIGNTPLVPISLTINGQRRKVSLKLEGANPQIHYTQTAPEIYQQMAGQVDAIFVAVSTGGTLAGIGRYFREMSPQTQVIGVDAHGSVVFGTPSGPRKLTGIGASRKSDFINQDLYDHSILVRDEEAFAFCRALFEETAIMVGGSGGAVLAACARYLAEHPTLERCVCICPDTGKNYTSSIFDDAWLRQHTLDLTDRMGAVQAISLDDLSG
jgi:cysteine synthase A